MSDFESIPKLMSYYSFVMTADAHPMSLRLKISWPAIVPFQQAKVLCLSSLRRYSTALAPSRNLGDAAKIAATFSRSMHLGGLRKIHFPQKALPDHCRGVVS